MNWIECDPKEATRCVCNGVELKRDRYGRDGIWQRGLCSFEDRAMQTLNAKFYKEGPKVYKVTFCDRNGGYIEVPPSDGFKTGDRVHVTKVDA
jgi:hypothetical protein